MQETWAALICGAQVLLYQTITVTASGVYSVTVTNPTSGCAVTDEVTATVNYTPIAGFILYSKLVLTVVFTNTSTDGASYSWTFGDGGTSTTMNPSHTHMLLQATIQ